MHDEHFEKLLDLIELEREAEKEENKRELQRFPMHIREALGKTVPRLKIVEEDVGVGGIPLLILKRVPAAQKAHQRSSFPISEQGGLSPFHAMNQGDNVLLTFPAESNLKPVEGTLYDVGERQVTVALKGTAPDPLPNGHCQLDMLGSDATYKRMRQALGLVKRSEKPDLVRLRNVFMGTREGRFDKPGTFNLFNDKLNKFQVEAVAKCLAAEDAALVHGPPGTGKTTVLVEIILQSVKNGMKVLASAPSNIAVDNMVEKLLESDLRIVRMGHPARILEPLRHVTLTALEEEHELKEEMRNKEKERHRLLTQLHRKESRGRGMGFTEKRAVLDEIQRLGKEARDLEFALRRQIIQEASVVLVTHGGVGGALNRIKFDLLVMDEASQSTEPLSWIPITLAKKVVFAGDSCQLPPTIYSGEASERGLSTTLFERLKKILSAELQSLLRIQYRMNERIMAFSSENFYENKLVADKSVQFHLAKELPGVEENDLTSVSVAFIDTVGTGYNEEWNELLESRENEGEARLAMEIFGNLRKAGIKLDDIAIITPYVAQVKRLRLLCPERGVEIGSIDSFQGREKEVVILSLVRSNEQGEVGFLSDTRRMNVGMTRARRLLIVIGDSSTIARHPFYDNFIEYVDSLEAHRSAWEWLKN